MRALAPEVFSLLPGAEFFRGLQSRALIQSIRAVTTATFVGKRGYPHESPFCSGHARLLEDQLRGDLHVTVIQVCATDYTRVCRANGGVRIQEVRMIKRVKRVSANR